MAGDERTQFLEEARLLVASLTPESPEQFAAWVADPAALDAIQARLAALHHALNDGEKFLSPRQRLPRPPPGEGCGVTAESLRVAAFDPDNRVLTLSDGTRWRVSAATFKAVLTWEGEAVRLDGRKLTNLQLESYLAEHRSVEVRLPPAPAAGTTGKPTSRRDLNRSGLGGAAVCGGTDHELVDPFPQDQLVLRAERDTLSRPPRTRRVCNVRQQAEGGKRQECCTNADRLTVVKRLLSRPVTASVWLASTASEQP